MTEPKPKRKSALKQIFFGLVLAAIVIVVIRQLQGGSSTAPVQPNAPATASASNIPPAPAAEQQLATIIADYAARYSNADNDMLKGATRPERAKAICSAIPAAAVDGWIGRINTLSSNNDGNGVLGIAVSDHLTLETWNNAISDIGDNTLIPSDSPLFKTVATMKEGDLVRFAGTFLPSSDDCFREQSLTVEGGMSDPTFVFRFSSVEPIPAQ